LSTGVLGKQVEYPKCYSPDVLEAVPRYLNREIYGIREEQLPFCGVDVWHAYELSFLTLKGLPVTGVLKMVIPCNSPFLVESKSLKLYLNSFNMEQYGDTPCDGLAIILNHIRQDVERLLKCSVKLSFFDKMDDAPKYDFGDYLLLEYDDSVQNTIFTHYTETPELLEGNLIHRNEIKVGTHLLRSNCKITRQPDWGSAFICIKGARIPAYDSLLRYIVSIRNENHFHEEICEMIYQRLWTLFEPDQLMVACIYTRRGGLDISPVRSSCPELHPNFLLNPDVMTMKLLRQ
jgi:7-cyano-7-deazaguanine reductase